MTLTYEWALRQAVPGHITRWSSFPIMPMATPELHSYPTTLADPRKGISLTLAVASVFETGIRLYCDTRVLYPYGENPHYLRGTLKAITLHPGLCIAYAGDVASALSAIRDLNIHRSSGLSLPEVISHLEQTHSRTPKTTEFIVASAVEGQALTVIKEGRGSRVNYCWIGDIDAFEEYQRLFHTTVAPAPSTTIDPRLRADLDR
jgi:hypothetical protein